MAVNNQPQKVTDMRLRKLMLHVTNAFLNRFAKTLTLFFVKNLQTYTKAK